MKRVLFVSILFFWTSFLYSQTLKKVWATQKIFDTPESVYYDKPSGNLFVSNIGGSPVEKDGYGFISIISPDGKIKKLKWVTGLNAPKGITVFKNKLYVTDIDRVVEIDIKSGKITGEIYCPEAVFLNDITNDDKGNLYVSDTRKNVVYKISNSKAEKWLYNINDLKSPNGMAFKNGKVLIGTTNGIAEADPENNNFKITVGHKGLIDGLIPLSNGNYIISDWKGKTELIGKSNNKLLLNTSESGINAADLGFIYEKNLLLIPTFSDNRVIAYKLTD